MDIRKAEPGDLTAVLELCAACTEYMEQSGISQWDACYPNREVFERDIAQGALFVAQADGKVIGCIVRNTYQDEEYAEIPWQYTEGKIAVIHRLMVLPAWQGAGVSRALLTFAEESAAREGYAAVRLDYFTRNPRAIGFYRKCGYQQRGTVRFRKGEFLCAEKRLAI